MSEGPLSEKELRRIFASLSEAAAPLADCPATEEIWEVAAGGAPAELAARVVEHTSRCFVCAETWRLAREVASKTHSGATAELPARALGKTAVKFWVGLAAAAVLLIAAALGILIPPRAPQTIVTRDGEESSMRSLVPEATPLPRGACVLRWSPTSSEARYTIRVGTQDLSLIASASGLEEAEYLVPLKSLEKVQTGATIFWRVEAEMPDGRRITSPAFMNKVE